MGGDEASRYMLLAPPGHGCAVSDWKALDGVNCYAVGHGADENQGDEPGYSLTGVSDEIECVNLCLYGCSTRGGVCGGCEFVVYDESSSTCYPKKGLHCDQCEKGDEASQYKLLAPPNVDTTDCAVPSMEQSIARAGAFNVSASSGALSAAVVDSAWDWSVNLNINCYATGHGADENQGDTPGYSIRDVLDKETCVSLCLEGCASHGGVCEGCEFVVYDQSRRTCYPKKGIHCDECVKGDQASQYMLLAPPGQGCAVSDWRALYGVNCYAVGHGADTVKDRMNGRQHFVALAEG